MLCIFLKAKIDICLVLKKPFLSLSRMVTYPEDYWKSDSEDARWSPTRNSALDNEHSETKRIAAVILEYNKLKLDRLVPSASGSGGWRSESTLAWNVPGDEKIVVPKFSW